MVKIKDCFKKMSVKTSFSVYILVCILSALLISLFFSFLCQFVQSQIYNNYKQEFEDYSYKVEIEFDDEAYESINGEPINGTLTLNTEDIFSLFEPFDLIVYNIFGILPVAFVPICFIICIIVTSVLFYKRQLQKPLEILDKATDNISENNLDFEIVYDKQNELGRLCSSFEKMRVALKDNNTEMWRQVEERKRLNAAVAHDLRTPLTVLKGQSEMLIKYVPQMPEEKIISTAEMMKRHITRLETYVNTMNKLQRLEDIEINKSPVKIDDAVRQMQSTGTSYCHDKKFVFSMSDTVSLAETMLLDFSIIMRVYENLLSNALRFSKDNITASVEVKNDCFCLTVSDDGRGFTEKDLSTTVKTFYKSVNESDNEHFGMGLNICRILCEKHGGKLKLANNNGAVVTATFKQ